MSKHKRYKIITGILITLIVILGLVLAWIIAGQLRRSNEIHGASGREGSGWKVLSGRLNQEIKPVVSQAADHAQEMLLASNEEKEKEKAEQGKLKEPEEKAEAAPAVSEGPVAWNDGWQYAGFSKIHTGEAMLYRAGANRRDITVAVNAGHGTAGGQSVYTQCHPDGSAKVTGGSTGAGATQAAAVSSGTTMQDGTTEAAAVLALAKQVKADLLAAGFDVLMIREGDDVQLDNIARTVIANNNADCHISLHYDSTQSNKGFFYISVPDIASYRSMEPVATHWQQHNALGDSIIGGMQQAGVALYGQGSMAIDLTQTSYSTIPSVDLEVGDRASDHSDSRHAVISKGIVAGISGYF